jgi:hypothetical protein
MVCPCVPDLDVVAQVQRASLPLKCLGVSEQDVLALVERASCVPDLDVVALAVL